MPDLTVASLPSSLKRNARWERFGAKNDIPCMLVHPHGFAPESNDHIDPTAAGLRPAGPAPIALWLHGRTAHKELDPGRYLRWMRSGIGVCAIDLPGHGERFDESLQSSATAFELIVRAVREIDEVLHSLKARFASHFNLQRTAIGGMSLGGMATLARLTQPHAFTCAAIEATTGDWSSPHLKAEASATVIPRDLEPIANLDHWREIPLQVIHARRDEWVSFAGQQAFIEKLRDRYADPSLIELIVYEETGAPHEHIGFGKHAADAKNRQTDFLSRWLQPR